MKGNWCFALESYCLGYVAFTVIVSEPDPHTRESGSETITVIATCLCVVIYKASQQNCFVEDWSSHREVPHPCTIPSRVIAGYQWSGNENETKVVWE